MYFRARIAVLAAAVLAVSLVGAARAASATVHRPTRPADVPGTELIKTTIRTRDGSSQAWILRVDLTNRHLFLRPALAGRVLSGSHETVPSMARRTHAVAGI